MPAYLSQAYGDARASSLRGDAISEKDPGVGVCNHHFGACMAPQAASRHLPVGKGLLGRLLGNAAICELLCVKS